MRLELGRTDAGSRHAHDAVAAQPRRGWRSMVVGFACLLPLAAAALEINTATRAELEQLNGVGVAMAERVLVERAKAPFRDWDDLQRRVKGMAGTRIERLQGQGVTVNGVPGSRVARDDKLKRRAHE
ncbi:MAG: ComEA family DNA-binding protein [Burkholderiaceae bacterium]